MSTFDVKARRVEILPHENADALELARIEGTDYQAIVKKGEFASGDVAIYIPEAAIVPEEILAEMGLEGALAGGTVGPDGKKLKNRVKAIRLRGALSQGLVYRPQGLEIAEGADYSEQLGISKWTPPIPTSMSGKAEPCPGILSYTDIENIKRFPDVLSEGEEVIAAEKAHGTCSIIGLVGGELVVSSKGMAAKGLQLLRDEDEQGRTLNVYWRMALEHGLEDKLRAIAERFGAERVHLYGETLGVQDLMYGLQKGELAFRAFDLRIDEGFLDYDNFFELMSELELPTVPVLYRGPFSRAAVEEAATGPETISGGSHVREGVVVRPVSERHDPDLGRVILKVISPDYLLRKGDGTEFE